MNKKVKTVHIIEYFNNTVYCVDRNDNEEYQVSVGLANLNPVKFKVIEEDIDLETRDGFLSYLNKVKNLIREDIIADTAVVLLYMFKLEDEQYTKLKTILDRFSEDEIKLKIFQQNLYNGSLNMVNTLVIDFRENLNKYTS